MRVRYCVVHQCTVTDPIDGDPWNCARAEWEPDVELGCEIVDAEVSVMIDGSTG